MDFNKLNLKHIVITGAGSAYPIKNRKTGNVEKVGLAFYYQVGNEKLRKAVTGATPEIVEEKIIKFLTELDKMIEEKSDIRTTSRCGKLFADVAYEWYETEYVNATPRGKKLSFTSIDHRRHNVDRLCRAIGDIIIEDTARDEVARELFTDKLLRREDGGEYSFSSMDKLQQCYRKILMFAQRKGYIERVPQKVQLPASLGRPHVDDRFLDREQIAALISAVEAHPKYSLIVEIIMCTGLRQEECLALDVDSFAVSSDMTEIIVNKTVVETAKYHYELIHDTKTRNSNRRVVIPDTLREKILKFYNNSLENELAVYLRKMHHTEKLIFVDQEGEVTNLRYFQRSFWNYVLKRVPVGTFKKTGLHMLRHSYASLMAEKIPAEQLARILGDSYNTVFNNYYSLSKNAKMNIAQHVADMKNSIMAEFEKDNDNDDENEVI